MINYLLIIFSPMPNETTVSFLYDGILHQGNNTNVMPPLDDLASELGNAHVPGNGSSSEHRIHFEPLKFSLSTIYALTLPFDLPEMNISSIEKLIKTNVKSIQLPNDIPQKNDLILSIRYLSYLNLLDKILGSRYIQYKDNTYARSKFHLYGILSILKEAYHHVAEYLKYSLNNQFHTVLDSFSNQTIQLEKDLETSTSENILIRLINLLQTFFLKLDEKTGKIFNTITAVFLLNVSSIAMTLYRMFFEEKEDMPALPQLQLAVYADMINNDFIDVDYYHHLPHMISTQLAALAQNHNILSENQLKFVRLILNESLQNEFSDFIKNLDHFPFMDFVEHPLLSIIQAFATNCPHALSKLTGEGFFIERILIDLLDRLVEISVSERDKIKADIAAIADNMSNHDTDFSNTSESIIQTFIHENKQSILNLIKTVHNITSNDYADRGVMIRLQKYDWQYVFSKTVTDAIKYEFQLLKPYILPTTILLAACALIAAILINSARQNQKRKALKQQTLNENFQVFSLLKLLGNDTRIFIVNSQININLQFDPENVPLRLNDRKNQWQKNIIHRNETIVEAAPIRSETLMARFAGHLKQSNIPYSLDETDDAICIPGNTKKYDQNILEAFITNEINNALDQAPSIIMERIQSSYSALSKIANDSEKRLQEVLTTCHSIDFLKEFQKRIKPFTAPAQNNAFEWVQANIQNALERLDISSAADHYNQYISSLESLHDLQMAMTLLKTFLQKYKDYDDDDRPIIDKIFQTFKQKVSKSLGSTEGIIKSNTAQQEKLDRHNAKRQQKLKHSPPQKNITPPIDTPVTPKQTPPRSNERTTFAQRTAARLEMVKKAEEKLKKDIANSPYPLLQKILDEMSHTLDQKGQQAGLSLQFDIIRCLEILMYANQNKKNTALKDLRDHLVHASPIPANDRLCKLATKFMTCKTIIDDICKEGPLASRIKLLFATCEKTFSSEVPNNRFRKDLKALIVDFNFLSRELTRLREHKQHPNFKKVYLMWIAHFITKYRETHHHARIAQTESGAYQQAINKWFDKLIRKVHERKFMLEARNILMHYPKEAVPHNTLIYYRAKIAQSDSFINTLFEIADGIMPDQLDIMAQQLQLIVDEHPVNTPHEAYAFAYTGQNPEAENDHNKGPETIDNLLPASP